MILRTKGAIVTNFKKRFINLKNAFKTEPVIFDIKEDKDSSTSLDCHFNYYGYVARDNSCAFGFMVERRFDFVTNNYTYFLCYHKWFNETTIYKSVWNKLSEEEIEVTEKQYKEFLETISKVPSNRCVIINF